jgi:hypothetical protein
VHEFSEVVLRTVVAHYSKHNFIHLQVLGRQCGSGRARQARKKYPAAFIEREL